MARNNDMDRDQQIPENDPSKAMDSKREVERSNDEKTDQDFPGYPHYPAKEDIMDQRTGTHRVDADVENLPSGHNATGVSQRFVTAQESENSQHERRTGLGTGDDDLDRVVGSDSSGDEADLSAIDGSNAEIGIPQNVSNEEVDEDLPGTDLEEEEDRDRQ
jgi:hypothetical protein